MIKTAIYNANKNEEFDWEAYFSTGARGIMHQQEPQQVISRINEHLKENKFRMTLALSRVMCYLLKDLEPEKPRILELGAATGVLTRWMLTQYGGSGVLVDNSNASYEAYNAMRDDLKKDITYIKADLFKLELEKHFDLVCSFGLVEHFKEKKAVIDVHKKFVSPTGIIVIIVPLDSPLTRTFFEVHHELNLGYRELLTRREFSDSLVKQGMKVIRTKISRGYSYDFVGAVCYK